MREGDAFAGCTVISVCGTGAYGTVYLVEDALGRKVALKVFHSLSPDDKVLEALRRYAELPSSIDILVRILHFGVEDGRLFYLMEAADNASDDKAHYLPDTLALRLERKGRLDLEEALAIYRQLLKGMAVLHKLGLVHRDIKPANIFYVNGKIKLGDPDLLNDYTKTLSVAGSLGFIPPEFLTAKQPKTPVGDIYALGKTFYCSVTGEMPESYPHYPTDLSADTLYRIVLPLSRICNRNPEMRASTCSECLELLSQERNADTSHWRQFLTKMALSRRYRNIAVGVAVLLLIMVALLGYGAADFIARIRRLNEEALAKSNARRENMAALVPKLKLQLPEAQHADFEQQFTRAEQLLKKGRRNAFNRALDGIEERLREIAAKEVPPQGRDFDSIANMLGYLASPLGSQCLDLEKRSELKDTALHDAQALSIGDSPCLGKDFTNPTYLTNMQFKLVFMPPGKFISPVGSRYTEDKSKLIAIDYPYWIFDREISNEICNQLLGVDCVAGEGESMPCTQIGWYEIIHLCQELTDHWRSPYVLPKGYAVRPPTEAEWEYAARGGKYHTDMVFSSSNTFEPVNKKQSFAYVNMGKPNTLGLIYMTGNLDQWCEDWYSETFYKECLDEDTNKPVDNPVCLTPSLYREFGVDRPRRVLRGGDFKADSSHCRVYDRYSKFPSERDYRFGLRLVLGKPLE